MPTYTFETVFLTPHSGKTWCSIKVLAPSESIAWEQLGEKVRNDPTLYPAYQKKLFKLIGTDQAPDLTDEQRAVGRRVIDKSADRNLLTGRYRGENVAFICETKELPEGKIAYKPVAIVITDEMMQHVVDFQGTPMTHHGIEWEE